MKFCNKAALTVIAGMLVALFSGSQAMAATNDAVDGGTTSLTLNPSGLVTVNAAAITLIKQVYDMAGTCLASDANATLPADDCGPDTITVATGTPLQFLIYVRNTTALQLSDVRFEDIIDDTAGPGPLAGFTYSGPDTIKTTTIPGLPSDVETADNIYLAAVAGTVQSDAANSGANEYTAITDAGGQAGVDEYVTVGAVAGQANETLNIPANSTFAVLIPVTKN